MNRKSTQSAFGLALALGLNGPTAADVTIDQTFKIDAGGALSMAAMEGTTVTSIASDNARTDSDLEFKSRLMRTVAGSSGNSTNIVKLGEERILDIDYENESYSVTTFEELRAQTEQALQQMEEMRSSQKPGEPGSTDLPVSEQNCQWDDADISAREIADDEKIAGLTTKHSVITATQICTDPESGKACELTWTLEQWLAAEAPGGDEVTEFWKGYAEKLGLDEMVGPSRGPSMTRLFSQYRQGWDEINKQYADLEGYPVRTKMQLEIGGAECTTPQGQPISYENVFGEAMADAAASAMTDAAGGAAAETIGSTAGGSVGGAIAKSLFSGFGKKKKKPEPEPVAAAPAGPVRLFQFTSETTRIDTQAVDADVFEAPADFTLNR